MEITLPPGLDQFVQHLVQAGRYADEGDVVRTALRVLERQEFDESPALESALLEGVRSPHRPYGPAVLDSIRQSAQVLS
ncbi:antitoxin ParD1/3/4 [Prosthecobacter fusiformis]|uniref:Antitoxin ParD1/3/4 n=1 Tax=Prosthecobacter fusiformis TaxID=48464 RepID=A0A4R7RZT8_9BACT|nr:type II toxin-antitoxin system ParD family antitoxin [Prosthecobacter fusiformis]TDU70929.1 antitoxin ParD1/3/4 [Prosthecobacter fusiformis]